MNYFDRWALWAISSVIRLSLRLGLQCERPDCQITSGVGQAMRAGAVFLFSRRPSFLYGILLSVPDISRECRCLQISLEQPMATKDTKKKTESEYPSQEARKGISPEFRATRLWRRKRKRPLWRFSSAYLPVFKAKKGPRKSCAKPWLAVIRA